MSWYGVYLTIAHAPFQKYSALGLERFRFHILHAGSHSHKIHGIFFFFSEKEKRSQLNEISSLLPNALPEARSKAIHFGEFCTSTPSISTIEE